MKQTPKTTLTLKGYCVSCGNHVDFKCEMIEAYSCEPLLSETISCPICNCANRIRAAIFILNQIIGKSQNLNIHCLEQITPFFERFKLLFGDKNTVTGSEFLGENIKSGTAKNGIRHEDVLDLSFEDNSLDMIISNHVYEHVCDIDKTLEESYRVLSKGAKLIFSIPFDVMLEQTIVRARIQNGKIIYLAPKEIHGNPVSKDGSLAFYTYGWDIFDKLKKVGFEDVYLVSFLNEEMGNIVEYPMVTFVAEK